MECYYAVLFDLDGTLSNSQEGICKCVKYALESFGIHETDEEKLKLFIGPPLEEMFMEIYGFTKEEAVRARNKYRERFQPIGIYENEPYEGILEMLAVLHKEGIILGVATSKPEEYARKILDKYQMSRYFTVISGADLEGKHVTKTAVLSEALRRLREKAGQEGGALPERIEGVLMVGDRKYDVEGAKECGVPCVGVGFGFAKPGELEQAGADYYAETVEDLKELLLKICRAKNFV